MNRARERDDHRKHDDARERRKDELSNPVAPQAGKELRADLIADGKEEQEKDERLERTANGNVQLADENAREQRRGHVAQAELPDLQWPDPITDREREEDRQLGVLSQRRDEPRYHGSPTTALASTLYFQRPCPPRPHESMAFNATSPILPKSVPPTAD